MKNIDFKQKAVCPACQGDAPFWQNLYDDRHGYSGQFAYHHCSGCGLVFQPQRLDEAEIGRLYSEYYPRSSFSENDWQPYAESSGFSSWLDGKASAYMHVPKNVRILDIGCGFGNALGYHRNRGCSAHGTEMDSNALRVAASQNLDIRHGPFKPGEWEPHSFDYVTLDQVLEHTYEPVQLLRNIAKVIKKNGTLLLTTPHVGSVSAKLFGRRWIHWHPPYHAFLYTRAAVTRVLRDAGFNVAAIKTVTASAWMQYQFIHCGLRSAEGEKTPFWDPRASRELSSSEQRWLRAAGVLHRRHAFSLATRLVDALGAGDNLIIWARPVV